MQTYLRGGQLSDSECSDVEAEEWEGRVVANGAVGGTTVTLPLVERQCTCGRCTALRHARGDHLCCRQMLSKWQHTVGEEEQRADLCVTEERGELGLCVTETLAYKAVTSDHSLRVLAMCRWDTSGVATKDPPQNEKMRHNGYVAVSYHLDGKCKTRTPLPSCVMTELRQRYPAAEYTGFQAKKQRRV